jgi:hypothetical protein
MFFVKYTTLLREWFLSGQLIFLYFSPPVIVVLGLKKQNLNIYRPDVQYYESHVLPDIAIPQICRVVQLPSFQWCHQEFFGGDFFTFEPDIVVPYDRVLISKMKRFYRERNYSILPKIPDKWLATAYKSV